MGIETLIASGISALAGATSVGSQLHQNELNATDAYQKNATAETKATALAAKQKASQESYQATIDRLNQQFEAGLQEKDAAGNYTDLGLAMKQISDNYMQTSTTALRQWAAERGVAGSTIEGQAVANAATEASKQAQTYKQNERAALYSQKESLADKAKTLYNMDLTIPTEEYNLANAKYNAAETKTNNAYNPSTDIAALLGNVNKIFSSGSSEDKTVTGNSTKSNAFDQETDKRYAGNQ